MKAKTKLLYILLRSIILLLLSMVVIYYAMLFIFSSTKWADSRIYVVNQGSTKITDVKVVFGGSWDGSTEVYSLSSLPPGEKWVITPKINQEGGVTLTYFEQKSGPRPRMSYIEPKFFRIYFYVRSDTASVTTRLWPP